MTELKIRASYAPTVHACGQSWRGDDGIDPTHEYSKLGTAVHEALAKMVQDQSVDLSAIALIHGVDEAALATAYGYGVSAWNNPKWPLKSYFPEAKVEQETAAAITLGENLMRLTGHIDVVGTMKPHNPYLSLPEAYILDWKLGNISRAYWQVAVYAANSVKDVGIEGSICTAFLVNLMDGKARVINFMWHNGDLHQYGNGKKTKKNILKELYDHAMDETYHPGPDACLYCKRRFSCEARRTSLSVPVESLAATQLDMPDRLHEIISRGRYPEFRQFRIGLKRIIADCEKTEKEIIRAEGEIVSGGKRYTIEEGVARREINISDVGVWRYLREKLGGLDELRKMIGYVSLKPALTAIGARAEHGKKGKAKQAAQAELENLRGIAITPKYTVIEEEVGEDEPSNLPDSPQTD